MLGGVDLIWADAGRGSSIGTVTVRKQRVCISSVAGSSLINKLGHRTVLLYLFITVLGRHPS
jgi:hypothetical protein